MIKKHLEEMRKRSYTEKSNAAFLISLIITSLIALVWFINIFTDPRGYFQTDDEKQNLANSGSLFDVFKEGVK